MKYKRLTKKGGLDFTDKNLSLKDEMGYSYIYNRLAELEDKIENRTLVAVPCKVGDTLYFVFTPDQVRPSTFTVEELSLKMRGEEWYCYAFDKFGYGGLYSEVIQDWYVGKNKDIAEARLKELKESK